MLIKEFESDLVIERKIDHTQLNVEYDNESNSILRIENLIIPS